MSDDYEVRLSAGARRVLQAGPAGGLPLAAATAILEFIGGAVRTDPWRVSKPLHNELAGMRGARRGEYRLILKIDDGEHVVRVLRVDHRADIYRGG